MIEVEKLLQEKPYSNANTKILALHHPPTNLHDSFITNDWRLENWEDVRDFCERVGFDFILAGHWHNPSSKNRVQKLGKGKLVISACDVSAERAIVRYHLIDIPTRGANKLKRYSWGE
jgi:Icc-related predicted phosphoesterase